MFYPHYSLRFAEATRITLSLISLWGRVGLAGIFAALFALPLLAQNGAPVSGASASRAAARAMRPPVLFERNDGQADERALYVAHGLGYSLFLTREGAAMVLHAPRKDADGSTRTSDYAARLSFIGANPHAEVAGIAELPGNSNYFSGSNPGLWKTGIPRFSRVLYRDIYPGVDLVFYAHDGQLEFDFNVAPGANPDVIRLESAGRADLADARRRNSPPSWQPRSDDAEKAEGLPAGRASRSPCDPGGVLGAERRSDLPLGQV